MMNFLRFYYISEILLIFSEASSPLTDIRPLKIKSNQSMVPISLFRYDHKGLISRSHSLPRFSSDPRPSVLSFAYKYERFPTSFIRPFYVRCHVGSR